MIHNHKIKSSADEIINDARKQIGSTNYNLFNDNCQHFCTSKRYGESKSIEGKSIILNVFNLSIKNDVIFIIY